MMDMEDWDDKDSKYEFTAPKFHDFLNDPNESNVDAWFDNRRLTTADAFQFGETKTSFCAANSSMDGRESSLGSMLVNKAKNWKKSISKALKKPELTVPLTPKFMKKYKNKEKTKASTTEDRILAKMEEEKSQLKRQIETNQETMKKAITGASMILPTHSTKPLTNPEEPNFSARLSKYDRSSEEPESPKLKRSSSGYSQDGNLSNNTSNYVIQKPRKKSMELTRPEPFVFHSTNSNRCGFQVTDLDPNQEAPSPYEPWPKKIEKFQQSLREPIPESTERSQQTGLTQPESPQLMTKFRTKPCHEQLTTEEREILEVQNMPKFKATEVDRRILESHGELGVPDIKRPDLTEPQPFEFQTSKRVRERTPELVPESNHMIETKPINREIFEKVIGVPERKVKEPTVPQSPAITKVKRRRTLDSLPSEAFPLFKAHPLMDLSHPDPLPPKSELPLTKPEPFELIGEGISKKKKKKLLKEIQEREREEEERREFKANPIRSVSPEPLPSIERRELTRPEPFELYTEERGEHYKRMFAEKILNQNMEIENAFSSFQARPADVLNQVPFHPKRSTKPLTEIDNTIVIHTEVRAKDREKFDEYIKEKEALAEQLEKQRQFEEAEREKREIADLRQRMVHQAQPIRDYAPIVIKPSNKRLTEPASPMIGKKRKQSLA